MELFLVSVGLLVLHRLVIGDHKANVRPDRTVMFLVQFLLAGDKASVTIFCLSLCKPSSFLDVGYLPPGHKAEMMY